MSLDLYIIGIPMLVGGIAGAVIAPEGNEKEAIDAGRLALQKQEMENRKGLGISPDYSNNGHYISSQRTPEKAYHDAFRINRLMPKLKGLFIGAIAGGILGGIADYYHHQTSTSANAIFVPDIYLLKAYLCDYAHNAMDIIRA